MVPEDIAGDEPAAPPRKRKPKPKPADKPRPPEPVRPRDVEDEGVRRSGTTTVDEHGYTWEWLPGATAWTLQGTAPAAPAEQPDPRPSVPAAPAIPVLARPRDPVRIPARAPAIDAGAGRVRSLLGQIQPTERRRGR